MVLALAGDSTMTRSCLPLSLVVVFCGLAVRLVVKLCLGTLLRRERLLAAVFLVRLTVRGASSWIACFLRAGTAHLPVAVVLQIRLATITTNRMAPGLARGRDAPPASQGPYSPPLTHTIALRRLSSPAASLRTDGLT